MVWPVFPLVSFPMPPWTYAGAANADPPNTASAAQINAMGRDAPGDVLEAMHFSPAKLEFRSLLALFSHWLASARRGNGIC